MTEQPKNQFSLRTSMIIVAAFALGLMARNIASGLHPFAMQLTLPSSTTPVRVGEVLIVESKIDSTIDRRVTVLSDGTIKLPYVGDIDVTGKDVASIEKALTKAYAKFFAQPAIEVYRADASQPK